MYANMKNVMDNIRHALRNQNIPILPTLGNNDFVKHDQATSATNAKEVYSRYYDIFFTDNIVKPVDK
jgi:hypothetical protein